MKNLDDKIKKAFEQKESQLDKLDLWEAIEKELPEEKKDRKFFIWFLFGGLMILAGLLLNYNVGSVDQSDNPKAVMEKHMKVDENKSLSTSAINTNSDIKVDTASLRLSDNKDSDPKKQAINTNSKNQQKEIQVALPSENIVSPAEKRTSDLPDNSLKNVLPKESKAFPFQSAKENSLKNSLKESAAIDLTKDLIEYPVLKKEGTKTTSLFSTFLPFIKIPLPQLLNPGLVDTMIISTEVPIPYRPISKWSAKIYTNYLKLNRFFTGDNLDDLDQKLSSEKVRYAYNTGALVHYDLNAKLAVGIGIDYRVQEEVINWSGVTNVSTTPFQSDSAFFFNYFQKTFFVSGILNSIETSTRSLRNYNRIQQWSVPIEVNYTAIQNRRLKLHLTGGAQINLSNRMEGKFLGISNEIKEGAEIYGLYKKSNVHTMYGGLGIEFYLSPKFSLTSDFRYQSSFNIFQDELEVALRYRGYSIGLGIKRKL